VDAVVVPVSPSQSPVGNGYSNGSHHVPSSQFDKQQYVQATSYQQAPPPPIELQRQQPPAPIIIYGHLGRYECSMQCPFCSKVIMTQTKTRCDGVTWLFVLILFFVFWPLCWLPLCMPRCQRVHHSCPSCHRKVGITEPCS
jgi:LITAF-like zinc ribbon domain